MRRAAWLGWALAGVGLLAGAAGAADRPNGKTRAGYVVLAWNDLGMRGYNPDFRDLAVLPPL